MIPVNFMFPFPPTRTLAVGVSPVMVGKDLLTRYLVVFRQGR